MQIDRLGYLRLMPIQIASDIETAVAVTTVDSRRTVQRVNVVFKAARGGVLLKRLPQ